MFHCFHRLLCWIKSRVRDFLWKLFSFHTEMISASFLWGSVLLRGELHMQKMQIFKIWERPLFDIREYAFKLASIFLKMCDILHTQKHHVNTFCYRFLIVGVKIKPRRVQNWTWLSSRQSSRSGTDTNLACLFQIWNNQSHNALHLNF